jgi:DNA-binding response OmpR family regulator
MSKILIIEDDPFLQGLEASKLTKDGFDILVASSGDEALEKINEPNINLILLDLVLPNFDGFQVLEKVRATEAIKTLPVIVFSNLSEAKDVQKAKDLGATDFMVKSNFTLDELVERIKMILK